MADGKRRVHTEERFGIWVEYLSSVKTPVCVCFLGPRGSDIGAVGWGGGILPLVKPTVTCTGQRLANPFAEEQGEHQRQCPRVQCSSCWVWPSLVSCLPTQVTASQHRSLEWGESAQNKSLFSQFFRCCCKWSPCTLWHVSNGASLFSLESSSEQDDW